MLLAHRLLDFLTELEKFVMTILAHLVLIPSRSGPALLTALLIACWDPGALGLRVTENVVGAHKDAPDLSPFSLKAVLLAPAPNQSSLAMLVLAARTAF
jgi:hypothetical protein